MQKKAAEKLARALMRLHGLRDWQLTFEWTLDYYGCCETVEKTIYLSEQFIEVCDASSITDVVLHEVAHALVGDEHGHDAVWKAKAREIGAKPHRHLNHIAGRYQAKCSGCRYLHHRHTRPPAKQEYKCNICQSRLKYVDVTTIPSPEQEGYVEKFARIIRKRA